MAAFAWGGVMMAAALALATPVRAQNIVAAEAVYADMARQLAPATAHISAILTNPATDPHAFEPTPATARAVAAADIIIENGAGYDAWMDHLVSAAGPKPRLVINVASLMHARPGDNPHFWYAPATLPTLANALIRALPAGPAAPRTKLLQDLAYLQARAAALRSRYAGVPIAATEPVAGPLLQALGLVDQQARFELAVMNGAEPRASDIAAFENALRTHQVRALVTNIQVSNPASARLVSLARASGIPVVAFAETLPPGLHVQDWMAQNLAKLAAALAQAAPHAN